MNDTVRLRKELDKTMIAAFRGSTSAFLGSLLCSMEIVWDRAIPTAATNGLKLWWNPVWFESIPAAARETVLKHELWHVGRLHMIRCGNRDPDNWNKACDVRINNDLERDGASFVGIENCWKDHSVDFNGPMAEEDIYDLIHNESHTIPGNGSFGMGDGDLTPPEDHESDQALSNAQKLNVVSNVVRAAHQARLMNQAGSLPGDLEYLIKEFLDPVLPWEQLLMKFFTDLLEEDYTWARPNRRYTDIYLPSVIEDEGRLAHVMFFFDVSGSVTDEQARRFCGEVKYIQEVLKPKRLTLIQFDTEIQHVQDFEEEQEFSGLNIHGRGGTSLVCVKNYIEEHKPTAAIVFSDLECEPMEKLTPAVPVVWVCHNNPQGFANFGELIHLQD